MMWSRRRLSESLANVAIFMVSSLLCYVIGEFVFLRFVAPALPPFLLSHLPDLPVVTGRTSKQGALPHNYVAVLGDSYAEGLGDWMFSQGRHPSQYDSTHVLHGLTGADVISLGRWGYGSAEAMVLKPARVYLDNACLMFPKLERPAQILVYFFEGNDLYDNYGWVLRQLPDAKADGARATIARYLDERYGVMPWWQCHRYFAASLWSAFKLFRDRWRITEQRPNSISPSPHSDAPNRILSASEMLPAPKLYPPLWHDEDRGGEIAFIVFDEALAWLRKHFSEIAVTVVYLPSPAAVYRYPEPVIATGDSRRVLQSAAAIYADSQRICEHIRMLSLQREAGFIDTRRDLRVAASKAPLHGPLDWMHFNEAGYRALGAVLAQSDRAARNICVDWNEIESLGSHH